MASAVAKKGTKVLQTSSNTKEKGLSRCPTLGLIPMVLQDCNLLLQLSYPCLCLVVRLREALLDECGLGRRVLLKILQARDDISLSFIQNESTKDLGARPIGTTVWPRVHSKGNIHPVQLPGGRSGARAPDVDHTSRVALRKSRTEILLVFMALAKARSTADKLSACFAIPSNSRKLETN